MNQLKANNLWNVEGVYKFGFVKKIQIIHKQQGKENKAVKVQIQYF